MDYMTAHENRRRRSGMENRSAVMRRLLVEMTVPTVFVVLPIKLSSLRLKYFVVE